MVFSDCIFRRYLGWVFPIVIVTLFVMTGTAIAYDGCSQINEANGFATIFNNDVEMARAMALDAARANIVKPLGVNVESDTIYSMGLKIADWNRIKAGGYIVKESRPVYEQKDGGVWVKLEAWVKCRPAQEKMTRELLNQHKLLILTDGPGSGLIQSQIASLLSQEGYQYLESVFVENNLSSETWDQLKRQQLYDLNHETSKFMADLVVYIKSDAKYSRSDNYFDFYKANATISLFQISGDNKGVPRIRVKANPGTLATPKDLADRMGEFLSPINDHPNSFYSQIAVPIADEFMSRLAKDEKLAKAGVSIEISLQNLPNASEYHKFLYKLKSQRGCGIRKLGGNGAGSQ